MIRFRKFNLAQAILGGSLAIALHSTSPCSAQTALEPPEQQLAEIDQSEDRALGRIVGVAEEFWDTTEAGIKEETGRELQDLKAQESPRKIPVSPSSSEPRPANESDSIADIEAEVDQLAESAQAD